MFQTLWTHDAINSSEALQYNLSASGCKIKIQNSSKYAIDVFVGSEHMDRVEPYSFSVLPNESYTLKVKREVVSQNTQENELITIKTVSDETTIGSTTFTGVQTIEGDVNVEGNVEIDGIVNVAGKVEVDGDVQVNGTVAIDGDVNVNGSVEVNNVVQTETIIQNASIPITTNAPLEVNVQNASIPITGEVEIKSGTINANIENAQIGAEIINTSLSMNKMITLYDNIGQKSIPYEEIPLQREGSTYFMHYIFNTGGILLTDLAVYGRLYFYNETDGEYRLTVDETRTLEPFITSEFDEMEVSIGSDNTVEYLKVDLPWNPSQNEIKRPDGQFFTTYNNLFMKIKMNQEFCDKIGIQMTLPNARLGTKTKYIFVPLKIMGFNNEEERGEAKDLTPNSITFPVSKFGAEAPLDMKNSDIKNVNNIYMNDTAQASEGLFWKKTGTLDTDFSQAGHDVLNVLDGQLKLNGAIAYESQIQVHAGLDLNNLVHTGYYYSHSLTTALGLPTGAPIAGFITHKDRGSGYAIQHYEPATGNAYSLYVRRKVAGVWQTWAKVF